MQEPQAWLAAYLCTCMRVAMLRVTLCSSHIVSLLSVCGFLQPLHQGQARPPPLDLQAQPLPRLPSPLPPRHHPAPCHQASTPLPASHRSPYRPCHQPSGPQARPHQAPTASGRFWHMNRLWCLTPARLLQTYNSPHHLGYVRVCVCVCVSCETVYCFIVRAYVHAGSQKWTRPRVCQPCLW